MLFRAIVLVFEAGVLPTATLAKHQDMLWRLTPYLTGDTVTTRQSSKLHMGGGASRQVGTNVKPRVHEKVCWYRSCCVGVTNRLA